MLTDMAADGPRFPQGEWAVLFDRTQHIEIHIKTYLISHSTTCNQIQTTVFGAIEKVFAVMHLKKDQINSLLQWFAPARK